MPVIISTAEDGRVNITAPAGKFMRAVTHGGLGHIPGIEDVKLDSAVEGQIDRAIASGYEAGFASRFVKALVLGGETDAGAMNLIRQRHLSRDSNHRVHDRIKLDRFFRDAWRQDGSTGALFIDLGIARQIFAKRLIAIKAGCLRAFAEKTDVATLMGRRDEALEASHAALKSIDLHALADKMARASSADELKALWPSVLPLD